MVDNILINEEQQAERVFRLASFADDSGIIGSVISPNFTYFHTYFDHPNDAETGAIVSLLAAGCFFGAAMAGYTSNKWGRRRTIQIGSAIATVGELDGKSLAMSKANSDNALLPASKVVLFKLPR